MTLIVPKQLSFEYFNTFYLGLHLCFVNGNLYLAMCVKDHKKSLLIKGIKKVSFKLLLSMIDTNVKSIEK